jgi:TPR repeat protein
LFGHTHQCAAQQRAAADVRDLQVGSDPDRDLRDCRGGQKAACTRLTVLADEQYAGKRGAPDLATVATLFGVACEGGELRACYDLGIMYRKGEGVAANVPAAIKLFTRSCEGGYADGCTPLGYLFAEIKSWELAAKNYKRGCDGGSLRGCSYLGELYLRGEGVEHNLEHAAAYLKRACITPALSGCDALTDLATIYFSGGKVAQDYEMAALLFAQACEGGVSKACNSLGALYASGKGVKKSWQKAAELSARSCTAANATGCDQLGTLYIAVKDYLQAATAYDLGCRGGELRSCVGLGIMYGGGRGIGSDPAKATALFKRACDGGNSEACALLRGPGKN